MNKKQVKQIEITEVKVNRLNCSSDITGEYTTHCDVDFMLSCSFNFTVFDKEHLIDRIKMRSSWDEIELIYANQTDHFSFPVTKTFVHKILDRIRVEQKEGCLKGWKFDDEVFEILTGERETSSTF